MDDDTMTDFEVLDNAKHTCRNDIEMAAQDLGIKSEDDLRLQEMFHSL